MSSRTLEPLILHLSINKVSEACYFIHHPYLRSGYCCGSGPLQFSLGLLQTASVPSNLSFLLQKELPF